MSGISNVSTRLISHCHSSSFASTTAKWSCFYSMVQKRSHAILSVCFYCCKSDSVVVGCLQNRGRRCERANKLLLQGCVRYGTGILGTDMDVVPKLLKCPVPVLMPRLVHFARPWTQASKPALTDSSLAAKRRAEALHVVFFSTKHPSPAR